LGRAAKVLVSEVSRAIGERKAGHEKEKRYGQRDT
jgi:hypothetical protein